MNGRIGSGDVCFGRRWHMIDELALVGLASSHKTLESICIRLETVADALPELPSEVETGTICDALARLLPDAEGEAWLPDSLFENDALTALGATLLARVRERRVACSVQAYDLIAAFNPAPDERPVRPDTLGYMLRSFFDGCRQAMAFEALVILVLGGPRLTRPARSLLIERLATS